jgi:hypothetical protein
MYKKYQQDSLRKEFFKGTFHTKSVNVEKVIKKIKKQKYSYYSHFLEFESKRWREPV